ncbi:MAG TPA: glycosyltransferase [Aquabacterium sp.]|nr:glycosyltransferase [Aquabacterium sp.]
MSSRPSINLVFQTDDGHAWMTGIALRSLIDAFSRSPARHAYSLQVSFISHGLNEANRRLLDRAGASDAVELLTEVIDYPLKAATPDERRIELFTMRLRFPQVLPHLDRILFLDSDILVLDDISKLWEIDLGDHWLGAAACLNTSDDVSLRNYNHEFKIQFKHVKEPINGGVVMMDLRRMRQLDASAAMVGWLQAHRDAIYNPDQEAISIYCGGRFAVLPPEWNFRLFAEPYWTASWRSYRDYVTLKPAIVHFQSPLRPNLLRGRLPYFTEWLQCHDEVVQRRLTDAKRMDYFMFAYFEFFDVISLLGGVMASYRWRTFLTGVFLCPYAIPKYVRYLLSPEQYRFRIYRLLPDAAPAVLRKSGELASSP